MSARKNNGQDPDDYTCRPASFSRPVVDGEERTYFIHSPWHITQTRTIGEMVVRFIKGTGEVLISIVKR